MDLVCIDFTKVDPLKSSKENILVLTDAFTKFSQAFITPNQKALTMAKITGHYIYHLWSLHTMPCHIVLQDTSPMS